MLVAIALIEAGMSPLDAVEYVRKFRRGAFNSVQIGYLDTYKRGSFSSSLKKLRMPAGGSSKDLASTTSSTASAASGFFSSIKRVPSPMEDRTAGRRGSPSPTGDAPNNSGSLSAPSANGYGGAVPSGAASAAAPAKSSGGFGSFFRSFGKKSSSPTPAVQPPANPPSPPGAASAPPAVVS